MGSLAVLVGALLVAAAMADLVNTLVVTNAIRGRFWLSTIYYRLIWRLVRVLADVLPGETRRNRLLGLAGPVSVLGLLVIWVTQQIVGFALIWWGVGGLSGVDGFADAVYFSGVTYLTLGFGDVVPVGDVPRLLTLVEGFCGVITTALMIGYLPTLYGAYAERERKLTTLDDGTETRITPTSLVISRTPSGDPAEMFPFFESWEDWIAGVLETHTTLPMLTLFRSKHPGQSWITALGLVADSALHLQIVNGAENRSPYWALRRATRLLQELTRGADLGEYRRQFEEQGDDPAMFETLHASLRAHGFDVIPLEEAQVRARHIRSAYGPELEYLIDVMGAPRGFWGHEIGRAMDTDEETVR